MKTLLFTIGILLFFNGCSTKVQVQGVNPAKTSSTSVKNIAIVEFKNDRIGLSNSITNKLDSVEFKGKKFFTIVDRNKLNLIMNEQKLLDKGITESSKSLSKLTAANSIMSGTINSFGTDKDRYFSTQSYCSRYHYVDGKRGSCARWSSKQIICYTKHYYLNADVSVTDVHNGEIIYSQNFNKQHKDSSCNGYFDSEERVFDSFKNQISNEVSSFLAPSKHNFYVEVIEDEDIDYTDEQEILLENGIKFLNTNIENSLILFKKLAEDTEFKSTTALYNYALCLEITGDLDKALIVYKKANELNLFKEEPNELISQSYSRIKNSINNSKKVNNQILAK